jgi:hypothetical protein
MLLGIAVLRRIEGFMKHVTGGATFVLSLFLSFTPFIRVFISYSVSMFSSLQIGSSELRGSVSLPLIVV